MVAAKHGLRSLALWMNGERVGDWFIGASGRHTLQYCESWRNSRLGRPLSLSLPLQANPHRGDRVRWYFENLLPDNPQILEHLANRFRLRSTEAFVLLAEIGRDCVGALQIVPGDEEVLSVREIRGVPLTDEQVAERLRATPLTKAWGSGNPEAELRISIAGAQEKTALLRWGGQWQIPLGTTPTTHILKLPLGRIGVQGLDLRLSLENEWLCLRILEAFGLPVPKAELLDFDGVRTLAVERFDRRTAPSGTWIWRLPQEDLCQATGTSPLRKYESDGGPGMQEILGVLSLSTKSRENRRQFLLAQILFWLLQAPDGHAKNFSIRLHPGGSFDLTPVYDVMSAYPVLGGKSGQIPAQKIKMAMAVRTPRPHLKMQEIVARHWLEMARLQGMVEDVRSILDDLTAKGPSILATIDQSLPAGFPAKVADPILSGMLKAIKTKLG